MARVKYDRKEATNKKRIARQKSKRRTESVKRQMSMEIDSSGEPLTTEARTKLAIRALQRRALKCRTDLISFYEFVIRHETTKELLKTAAHQKVTFRFMVDHPLCVIRQPIGTGKTFGSAAFALWLMGQDQTNRGGIVSKTQAQSAKVLRMITDYITDDKLAAPLTMVFPWMQRTKRSGELWTQNAITIDRPAGIRDPSARAVGLDGAIGGARLSWLLGDDILDADNCLTSASRDQIHSRFDSRIMSRLDPKDSRAVVTNTPWDREDLTFQLEAAGWPTLVMDIYGFIKFTNVDHDWIVSTGLVRPSATREGWWRLVEHDPDLEETTTLWPERYSAEKVAELRRSRLPHEFARLFLCQPFDSDSTRCHRDWIAACKKRGTGQWSGGQISYDPGNPIYTGVDIAVGSTEKNDETVIFTFEKLKDGSRRVIDIRSGRWSGPEIMANLIHVHDKYGSTVSVETNSAQDFLKQFAQKERPDLRIRSHNTNRVNKHNIDFGVESVFTEIKNEAWIFPCDRNGKCPPEFENLFDECIYYQPPPAHTGDRLMAMWIAREASRRGGGGRDPKTKLGLPLQFASGGGF